MSSKEVVQLYRSMLRQASGFENYNFRSYFQRRVKEEFHKHRDLAPGSPEQERMLLFAKEQAQVMQRQMVVSKMYPPITPSIMEGYKRPMN